MEKVIFYHAGCTVCVSAEQQILKILNRSLYDLEVVHLGEHPLRIAEAEKAGVKSVPALRLGADNILHINYGASLADLKN